MRLWVSCDADNFNGVWKISLTANCRYCRKYFCTRTRIAHGAYRLFDVFRLFVRTVIAVVFLFFSMYIYSLGKVSGFWAESEVCMELNLFANAHVQYAVAVTSFKYRVDNEMEMMSEEMKIENYKEKNQRTHSHSLQARV